MDYAKTLKRRFRVGNLDLPERRKGIPVVGTRSKMHRCAFVAKQWRAELTYVVGECEIYKEERDVIRGGDGENKLL